MHKNKKKENNKEKKGEGEIVGFVGIVGAPTRTTIPHKDHKPYKYPHRHFSCLTASKSKKLAKIPS